jgi:hypothetical protein
VAMEEEWVVEEVMMEAKATMESAEAGGLCA